MHRSFKDTLRRLTGEKPERSPDWQRLRGRFTLSYALAKSELDEASFASKHVYRGRSDSGLVPKWLSGETTLNRISAQRLDRSLPGTLNVFSLPMHELLADHPMSKQRVRDLLEPYRATEANGAPFIFWRFPDHELRLANQTFVPVLLETDTQTLVTSGGLFSFIAILGVVRLAEATGDALLHLKASKDLYRALPCVLKLSWIRPHGESLIRQLEVVRSRMHLSWILFDVDLDVVWRQANDSRHEPDRRFRPINPATARFANIEDPILDAEIISGTNAKRLKLEREKNEASESTCP